MRQVWVRRFALGVGVAVVLAAVVFGAMQS
jgi:hypothetical protein